MSSRFPERALRVLAAVAFASIATLARAGDHDPGVLRVCAHPDNLPFSAEDESGFDNRIARLVADTLHVRLEYTWLEPQHGLVRKTLRAGLCDALFGLPEGYEGVAFTRPYYRSRYVFVYRHDGERPSAFDDPRLQDARIGVQVIGDDMAATPPGYALARAGVRHVVGFPVYGERPAVARMVDAVAKGELDAGLAWGPAAGYFAAKSTPALELAPAIPPRALASMPFEFAIGAAVRKEDSTLRAAIDQALDARRPEIDALLRAYHVPRTDAPALATAKPCQAAAC